MALATSSLTVWCEDINIDRVLELQAPLIVQWQRTGMFCQPKEFLLQIIAAVGCGLCSMVFVVAGVLKRRNMCTYN